MTSLCQFTCLELAFDYDPPIMVIWLSHVHELHVSVSAVSVLQHQTTFHLN